MTLFANALRTHTLFLTIFALSDQSSKAFISQKETYIFHEHLGAAGMKVEEVGEIQDEIGDNHPHVTRSLAHLLPSVLGQLVRVLEIHSVLRSVVGCLQSVA